MALPKLDPFILVYVAIIANSIFIFGCISVIIYYKCITPKVEAENQENEEEIKYNRNPFCFMFWCWFFTTIYFHQKISSINFEKQASE